MAGFNTEIYFQSPLDLSPNLFLRPAVELVTLTGTSVDAIDDLLGTTFIESFGNKPTFTAEDTDFDNRASVSHVGGQRLVLDTPGELSGVSADHTLLAVHKSAVANDGVSHVLFAAGESPFSSPNHIAFYWGFGGVDDLGGQFGGARADVAGSTQTTGVRYDAWVFDGTANTLEVFENGVSAGTGAYGTDNVFNTTTKLVIGSDSGELRHYAGKWAEIIYWNRKLSSNELASVWTYQIERYGL